MIEDPLIFGLIFGGLVIISAFFSASETSYSSMNRIRLQELEEQGNARAKKALALSEQFDLLLSTILIGNNIANIASASIATVFFTFHYPGAGPTLSTIVVTVLVLLFGEITPKSFAKENAETTAMALSGILGICMVVLRPLTILFDGFKKLFSKLIKTNKKDSMTESELLRIVDNAVNEGAIDQKDQSLIYRVIAFNDHTVEDILTPRVEISAIPMDANYDFIASMFKETGYSRLPVYNGTTDDIIGMIHVRDVMQEKDHDSFVINRIMKHVAYVHAQMKISDVLDTLQTNQTHMAIVIDEYGGTQGLATMEDVLEQLVGEIWDEHDERIDDFTKMPNGWYRVDCSTELIKFESFFDVEIESDNTTVAGWIAEELGKVPENYEMFNYENLQVRVTQVKHNRAVTCIVKADQINTESDI